MTAYVERVNLTLREHSPQLSRRTWSLARDEHSLAMYLDRGRAYHHFVVATTACAYPANALIVTGRTPRPWPLAWPGDAGASARCS
jgi:hypothetical protein